MWIDYPRRIQESVSTLATQERKLRGHPTADRVKMLRWLKSGIARSRRALARVLGYSERQLQRWWEAYEAGGLPALLEYQSPGGSTEQVTPKAWRALEQEMTVGRIAQLRQAQLYLQREWGILYRSLSGVSRLFRRHQVKLKTGRHRHRRTSTTQQEAFKKIRSRADPTCDRAGLCPG